MNMNTLLRVMLANAHALLYDRTNVITRGVFQVGINIHTAITETMATHFALQVRASRTDLRSRPAT